MMLLSSVPVSHDASASQLAPLYVLGQDDRNNVHHGF